MPFLKRKRNISSPTRWSPPSRVTVMIIMIRIKIITIMVRIKIITKMIRIMIMLVIMIIIMVIIMQKTNDHAIYLGI